MSPDGAPPPAASRGDVELARSMVDSVGRPEAPPEAGPLDYAAHLAEQLGRAMGAAMARTLEGLQVPPSLGRVMAYSLLILLVAGLVALLVRFVHRRAPRAPGEARVAEPRAEAAPSGADEGAAVWRRRLEEHLAAGRIAEALEAFWWWLARTLAGERADPSWTATELLRASDRPDLAPLLGRLEALEYGPSSPTVDDIEALAGRAEGALP